MNFLLLNLVLVVCNGFNFNMGQHIWQKVAEATGTPVDMAEMKARNAAQYADVIQKYYESKKPVIEEPVEESTEDEPFVGGPTEDDNDNGTDAPKTDESTVPGLLGGPVRA